MWKKIIDYLEQHQMACAYKKYLGIECPGCGMQRSFIELLKGNIIDSIILYPALLPTIFMFIYLMIFLKFRMKNGAVILRNLFIADAIIIIGYYIFKQINQ